MASSTEISVSSHQPFSFTRTLMEAMMGTDNESPSSTRRELEVIFGKRGNSTTRQEDIAIQVENDVIARVEKIYGDHELKTQIPRVPESLRQGANGGYDPQVISIGPYHWGKPRLEAMEKHKSLFLVEFLNRFPGRCLLDYIKEIESLELQLRSCYDKDIHITSKNFVEMMLVDGCFLIEFCLKQWEGTLNFGVDESGEDNPRPRLILGIIYYHVMRLLENQLPFFLLQRIYDIAITKDNLAWPSSFIQVALKFCLSTMRSKGRKHLYTPITLQHQLSKPIHHFMHLRHSLTYSSYSAQQPTFQTHSSESSSSSESSCSAICMRLCRSCSAVCMCLCHKVTFGVFATSEKAVDLIAIPSATELHDLGIKFKVSESRNYHIKFHGGIMEIPPIMLSNWTTGAILNMVAFERFHFEVEPFYIPFFMFIDLMVNTANDVALLRRYGIIDHDFGSDEEVALFFNQLMKGILKEPSSLSFKMSREVNKYCSIKRHRWRASLIRDYCGSPWSTLGLVVGFILLALTFVQSYMSLHSYFRPPHS